MIIIWVTMLWGLVPCIGKFYCFRVGVGLGGVGLVWVGVNSNIM